MIWHLIDSRSIGGAERHIETVARSCLRRGVAVSVVLIKDYGANTWLRQLEAAGVPHRSLDGSVRALTAAIAEHKPKLLHTHGYKAGIFGRLAAIVLETPIVSTFHSGARGAFPLGAYELLDEWTACIGTNIAVNEGVQSRLPWRSILMSSYVSAPPTDGLAELPRRVGFVGRLSREKGPDVFRRLAEGVPDVMFDVYGEGPLRPDMVEGAPANLVVHGAVDDLDPVWDSLGLIIMPSHFEGLPLTALEAMSHGIPVLGTAVGGLRELIVEEETGWFLDLSDLVGALAKLARWRALRPEEQRRMRRACIASVQVRYSEAKHFPALIEAYARAGLDHALLADLSR